MSGAFLFMVDFCTKKRDERRWWHTGLCKKRASAELLFYKELQLRGQY